MQFPESWLREFCDPPLTTRQLAETLTMGGLEVDDLRPAAPPFTQVVVGAIVDAQPHPNADRLRVCSVDTGGPHPLSIVCGAPNARAGIRVPCALVGAQLPPGDDGKPFEIRLGQLRGVESQGMLCSARELGLSDDHGGLLELPAELVPGTDLRQAINLDDAVFTLKVTPNLGHALSVYGVARELAALTGAPLKTPSIAPVAPRHADVLPVQVQAPRLCGRFSGRIVRGVDPMAPTPGWMVERLARCGQRSVSALVDISNYVMFEYGRPSHIFDLGKIRGGLVVRWACEGETLKLLNGTTVTLDADVGVIADQAQVESLAGIMGGEATAVGDSTRDIYIEAAFWWPEAIQGRSRRYNFSTDAGHRFERGVDPSQTVEHIERITALVLSICGGAAGPMDDQTLALPERRPVSLRPARAAKVIGLPLSAQACRQALERAGFAPRDDGARLVVEPPPHRFDIALEEDLIEEVARLVGYNSLPDHAPLAPLRPGHAPEARRGSFAVRHLLAALGYQEAITFSFVEAQWERDLAGNAQPIRLLNPIASNLAVMRSSLMGSLLQALKHNVDRRAPRARLFELGRVFLRDEAVPTTDTTVRGVRQPLHVAGLAYGSNAGTQWGLRDGAADFYDVKGDVESLLAPLAARFAPVEHPALHPGRCAGVWLGDERIGVVGELHPRWRQAWDLPQPPVLFELALDAVLARAVPQAAAVPRFPPAERDIAVIVDDAVTYDSLLAAVHAAGLGELLRDAYVFDVFKPKEPQVGLGVGEKSLAVRLTLTSAEATLTDEAIDAAVARVVSQLQRTLGARLRGE